MGSRELSGAQRVECASPASRSWTAQSQCSCSRRAPASRPAQDLRLPAEAALRLLRLVAARLLGADVALEELLAPATEGRECARDVLHPFWRACPSPARRWWRAGRQSTKQTATCCLSAMAPSPWTVSQQAELDVERARRLSVADPATKREFYRILAVRESARAKAALQDANRIRMTTPGTGRPATGSAANSGRFTTAQLRKRRFDEARLTANHMARRRAYVMAFAGWRTYAATTPRTRPRSSTTTSSAALSPAPAAPPPAAPAPAPPLAGVPPPMQQLQPLCSFLWGAAGRPFDVDFDDEEAPPPPAPAPAPPPTTEQLPLQPGIVVAETSAAPAPALPPAAERRPQPPTLPDEPMQPPAVTGARAKMRTPPRCATAPPLPSVATAADPVDAASTTRSPDTPSTTSPKAKRRLEPRLAGAAPAAAAAPHHPTMSPGPVPPHPAPKLPDAAAPPHAATSATATEVHASALPRAGTTPPPHPPSESAADAAGAAAWRRHLLLSPELRRYVERGGFEPWFERFQETRRGHATPHRTTADRRHDRRRSPRGTPHGGGPKGDTPPHA